MLKIKFIFKEYKMIYRSVYYDTEIVNQTFSIKEIIRCNKEIPG